MARPPYPYKSWAAYQQAHRAGRPIATAGGRVARAPFTRITKAGFYLWAPVPNPHEVMLAEYHPEEPLGFQWSPVLPTELREDVREYGMAGAVVAGPFRSPEEAYAWHQALVDKVVHGDPDGATLAEAFAAEQAAPRGSAAWKWWGSASDWMWIHSSPEAREESDRRFAEYWWPLLGTRERRRPR